MEEYERKFLSINDRNKDLLKELEDEQLINITVNVVTPEINIVFLHFNNYIVEVRGAFGSEILKVEMTTRKLDDIYNIEIECLQLFKGMTIYQSRIIGEPWNGYGFEISFKELLDRTLIIQSIYSGNIPKDFDDCLRIGIGNYIYKIDF
jgi:hypothetical protein